MIKTEINYSHRAGLTISTHFDYAECPDKLLSPFAEELNLKIPVQQELFRRGFLTMKTQLPEYMKCLYGGNDNHADFSGKETTPDYCHCGDRGACESEGFPGLCSMATIDGVHISPVELQLVEGLAKDLIYKEIANNRNRSFNTVNTQLRRLRDKLKTLRTPALVRMFMISGLIE